VTAFRLLSARRTSGKHPGEHPGAGYRAGEYVLAAGRLSDYRGGMHPGSFLLLSWPR